MDDQYELHFAPTLIFLWSEILCRLYKSPLDGTISRGPPCEHARKNDDIYTHVKDPAVRVRVHWTTDAQNT